MKDCYHLKVFLHSRYGDTILVKVILETRIYFIARLTGVSENVQTVCILLCDVIVGVLPNFMRFVVPTLYLPVRDSIPGVQRGP